jgi:TnpA family transposase
MKRAWLTEELAEHWSLTSAERNLLGQKAAHNRLGFALLLKFHQLEGRFPASRRELPEAAVAYVAEQLKLLPGQLRAYQWEGRSAAYQRVQIREYLGFRVATVEDARELVAWLSCCDEAQDASTDHLLAMVYQRCRALRVEPPTPDRVERLVRSAAHTAQEQVCEVVTGRLTPAMRQALDALLEAPAPMADEERLPLYVLKADPGRVSLDSLLAEIAKLQAIRQVGLPGEVFGGVAPRLVARFRQRVAAAPPRELRAHAAPLRYALLAAFCHLRSQELTDNLVDLLIGIIHKIGVRAERKVEDEMIADLLRVPGKRNLLYQFAEAAVSNPDGQVREVIYPVVGEQLLHDLVAEGQASGPAYRKRVHTVMRASYQHHYRRMVPRLLEVLQFRSNNAAHQPVIQALALLRRHVSSRHHHYAAHTEAPIEGVVRPKWRDLLLETGPQDESRVHRINYEICVLEALREKLRCKEVWVVGADRYRNPDDDLPADFDQRREPYYAALALPLAPWDFIVPLRDRLAEALHTLDHNLPRNPAVELLNHGQGRIKLTPLDAQPEPDHLDQLKAEVSAQWPMTNLLDILKETDLRVGFTDRLTSVASREMLDRTTLQRRLLLGLYGLGTNTGLKRISNGHPGESYRELLYVRRRFLHREALRAAIADVVNALLRVRQENVWGEGTTACASDAKKYGAWDQNLMTEWHVRYGGRGIMIYWHVERKSACIYSQLKTCSSSEVAAMIEGVLRHCTDAEVTRNYVDSRGQSAVAFAFCHLLGFDLLPRLKRLHTQKLYRPSAGQPDAFPNLQPVLTRPIRWDLIAQQYDEMVKYTTALRLGTAEAEAILRRFTRNNVQHPTYQALTELGKAVKTIFLCEYLGSEPLRREIHEGLNVIENWNSANSFIFYGRGGEIATNRRDDQEVAMLSLHLLQNCLVYINTLMVQQILAGPDWQGRLTPADRRALTPLFYTHINPYGTFELDMTKRLALEDAP